MSYCCIIFKKSMAYKALYRTYRPTTFEEVAGQQHIVRTFKNALSTGKISHAYLFAGPRGTGKTTMAKLLAKALNCEEGLGCQCNHCKNCEAINSNSHPDVLEIDAASNRGINEIKDLIEKVKYSTILGRYKVYIIDEVHMMTNEAFNALLKTLEEPPEHVIFILATTEPHKLLPTILSRCQRYDFGKVPNEEMSKRIQTILEKENIEYNQNAVDLIISLSDGGMRDALSMLDQVLAYSGNTLNENDVLSIFSLESKAEKLSLIHSLLKNDVSDVLNRVQKYLAKGTDIKRLTNDLLSIFKDALIYSLTNKKDLLESISDKEASEIILATNTNTLNAYIQTLMESLKDYKNVADANTLFEVTLLKMATLNKPSLQRPIFPEPQSIQKEEKIEKQPIFVEEIKQNPVKIETPVVEEVKEEAPPLQEEINPVGTLLSLKNTLHDGVYKIDSDTVIKIIVTGKKEIKNEFLDKWSQLKKYTTHPEYGKIATLLIDAHPLIVSNEVLLLEFPMTNLVEKANAEGNQKMIQSLINHVFHKHLFAYSVSRKESVDYQRLFIDLKGVKKLPRPDAVNLEFEVNKL
ncbi:MAG: DNA polymerase III subunit gamma/tau [Erysipelotrichaceae bacterium]|nr:DNA polymerase III subunit gamma/tau [Erysipelotrichaceae bacterium]